MHLLRQMGLSNTIAAKELACCLYDTCANYRLPREATNYIDPITVWWEPTWQVAEIGRIAQDQDMAQRLHLT